MVNSRIKRKLLAVIRAGDGAPTALIRNLTGGYRLQRSVDDLLPDSVSTLAHQNNFHGVQNNQ